MEETRLYQVLQCLPVRMRDEIVGLVGRSHFDKKAVMSAHPDVNEIRIRKNGRSSVVLDGRLVGLGCRVSERQTEEILQAMMGGALYSHRDSIASGYVGLRGGVRVGVIGRARYEDSRLVGVSDIRSIIIRIPTGRCHFESRIHRIFCERAERGMLIYSPPGVGKTTALRSLAKTLGGGQTPLRVVVIDERCEFDESDYTDCEVDILRGYKRDSGIEIAVSMTGAELLILDEIGGEDSRGIASAIRCGVPVIAAAHGGSLREIKSKPSLREILSLGAFDVFVGLARQGDGYRLSVDKE